MLKPCIIIKLLIVNQIIRKGKSLNNLSFNYIITHRKVITAWTVKMFFSTLNMHKIPGILPRSSLQCGIFNYQEMRSKSCRNCNTAPIEDENQILYAVNIHDIMRKIVCSSQTDIQVHPRSLIVAPKGVIRDQTYIRPQN